MHSDGAGDRARAASDEEVGVARSNGADHDPGAGHGGRDPEHEPRWQRPAWLGAAALAVVVALVAVVAVIAMAAGGFSEDEDGAPVDGALVDGALVDGALVDGPRWSATT